MSQKLRDAFEAKILDLLEDGFEKLLLNAAFENLLQPGSLRFNNFSYALRELLRHVLHRLAKDDEIIHCSWFTPTPNVKNGITRADRAKYAIQGGLSDLFVRKKLELDVREARERLISAIEVLNKFTHIEASTFNTPNHDVEALAENCLEATHFFIEQIGSCKDQVVHALEEHIDQHMFDYILSESIQSIDELATHHWVEGIGTNGLKVISIRSKSILIEAAGWITVVLQWGSDSDFKNDIGARSQETFRFTSLLNIALKFPLGQHGFVEGFRVDTSEWYA